MSGALDAAVANAGPVKGTRLITEEHEEDAGHERLLALQHLQRTDVGLQQMHLSLTSSSGAHKGAACQSARFEGLHTCFGSEHAALPSTLPTVSLQSHMRACRPGRIVLAVVWQAPDTMPSASPARTIMVPK